MQRSLLLLLAAGAGVLVLVVVTVKVISTPSQPVPNPAPVVAPTPAPPQVDVTDEERRADEERAKVMKGMNEHKKSTTALHNVFGSDEATTQPK